MESLAEILGRKKFAAPDEITKLKTYVKKRYDVEATIKLHGKSFILSVPNSALAGTLQMEKPKIIKACGLKKNLIIRTGR